MATHSEKPTTFEELIAPFNAPVQATAESLRTMIREPMPDFNENIYGGLSVANAHYSRGGPNHVVCGIQPALDHCKLYVHHVADVRRDGLRIEGSGKNTRHVKVRSVDDETTERLSWLLLEALRRSGL